MGGNSVKDDTDKKYGESLQYDPDFNGPIKNRSCTDILCLLLFIVFLITWIVVAVLAFRFGNPEKLINPTDSFGHVCGEGEFSDRPVLFFFDLTECARAGSLVHGCQTHQVCVKTCPDGNYFPAIEFITDNRPANQIPDYEKKFFCKYDTDLSQPARELFQKGFCAKYLLQSDAVGTDFHREVFSELDYPVKNPFVGRCVPTIKSLSNAIHNFSAKMEEMNVTEESVQKGANFISDFGELRNVGEKFLEDLQNSWKIILLALGVATLLSFIWIVLMRWLAWVMLWLSIFLVLGVLGVGCWYCFHRYTALVDSGEDHTFRITSFKSYAEQKKTWLGLGIFLAIVLVILVLMIIFLRSRIRLAIALVEESSKAVGSVITSLLFPVVPFLLQIAVVTFGLTVAVYISSASFPKRLALVPDDCEDCLSSYKNGSKCDDEVAFNKTCLLKCPNAQCVFFKYEETNLMTGAQIFNLFALFWASFFVTGLGQMVLAGAFATWYWTSNKSNMPTFVVLGSFHRTMRYHLGSLAFGSLIIAIVKMIRVLLEYVDRKLKEYTDNPVAKCIMCCLKCCFWCLENFIKFINRNAYILIAVYGKNFCSSAKDAFLLLMRNVARVVVLDKVTDFLLFLGKLTIVGCVGLLSFFFFSGKLKGLESFATGVNYTAIPVAIICLGSYLIATCFFNVYSMAVDTLFLCFLEDCEMNDGSQEKPYRMSKNLMKILGKKNKWTDPEEK